MATDRVSMDATSRLAAVAPVGNGQGSASARRSEAQASQASQAPEAPQTTATISPQAQDLATRNAGTTDADNDRSNERAEATRTDEQAAVQQMSLINTQLRRTYGA